MDHFRKWRISAAKKVVLLPSSHKISRLPPKNFLETRYAFQKLQSTFLNQFSFHNFGKDNGGIHVTKKGGIINTVGVYMRNMIWNCGKNLSNAEKESFLSGKYMLTSLFVLHQNDAEAAPLCCNSFFKGDPFAFLKHFFPNLFAWSKVNRVKKTNKMDGLIHKQELDFKRELIDDFIYLWICT